MFQQLINGILHDLAFKQPPIFHDFPTFLITLLAFALTYIFASGTYFAFEKRFIAFGHKQHYEGE